MAIVLAIPRLFVPKVTLNAIRGGRAPTAVAPAVELGKRESIVTEAHCRALAGLVGRPFEALVHHGAATRSRKTSFITLPVALSGSASTNSTTRGAL